MPEVGGAQVALFIDWDNLAISTAADHAGATVDLRRIVQVAQSYGTLTIARAYAEWGVTSDRLAVYRAGVMASSRSTPRPSASRPTSRVSRPEARAWLTHAWSPTASMHCTYTRA
jgi:hypothetical protein